MSLAVDSIFLKAIEADPAIMAAIGNRRWCTAAPMPEENFLNQVAIPYIIVNFDGFTSEQGTKDDDLDSGMDNVNVSITIAAHTTNQLAKIACQVRRAVHSYLVAHQGEDGVPYQTIPGGGRKFYDDLKPAYCMDLTWQCAVDFDLNPQDDEESHSQI